jgi:transposase
VVGSIRQKAPSISCQPLPEKNSKLSTVSSFRFYNRNLQSLYRAVPLPVKEQPSPQIPYAVEESDYVRVDAPQDWHFRAVQFKPPDAARPSEATKQQLTQAFYGLCDPPEPTPPGKRRKREVDGVLRSYKIRMFPTEEQKRELKRCFSAARHAYNYTVGSINNDGASWSFYERRAEYVNTDQLPTWAAGVNAHFYKSGIEDACNAFKTAHANMRAGNITHFDVHYRSHRRTRTEALSFQGDDMKNNKKNCPLLAFERTAHSMKKNRAECTVRFGGNLKAHGGIRLQDHPHVIEKLLAEGNRLQEPGKILWDKRSNAFYLQYLYVLPLQDDPDPQFVNNRPIVATDPGNRTFLTFFSPTYGDYGMLLYGMRRQLQDRCYALDQRTSAVTLRANALRAHQYGNRTKRQAQHTFARLKRKLAKERIRLHNWVKAAHYEVSNLLLSNFDIIVAPKLAVKQMVPRKGRVFGSQTARAMLTWSHGLFTQRLHWARARYAGKYVLTDFGEPGTSKTCCHCGKWHKELGGAKIFECPHCDIRVDRDVAGARNNFFATLGMALGMGYDGVSSN